MLDIKKILSRSWHVLWNYRVLWIFGFLLALAAGNANPGNTSNYSFGGDQRDPSQEFQAPEGWEGLEGDTFAEVVSDAFRQIGAGFQALQEQYPVEFRMGVAAAITLFVVILIVGLLITIGRYVSETSTIRMVDEYERTGLKVGFRQGWRYGWNRNAWQLFVVNFLINLPVLVLFVILGLVGWWIFSALMTGVEWNIISAGIAGAGLAVLSIFITVILMAVLHVVRDFAWRWIVLEGAGIRESLRQAWGLIRREWKNIGLMWLVMVGLNIAWWIAFLFLVIPLLILSVITALGGLVAAIIPSLLTVGVASIFSAPDYWPWIFAAIVGSPLFFIVAFSPILLVRGWAQIFQSSVWTLTYRELQALEAVSHEDEPVVGDLPEQNPTAPTPDEE